MARNRGCAYQDQIGPADAGRTVLDYLARRYPHSPAWEWADRLARLELELDGVTAAPTDLLTPGQRLTWRRPPWNEPDVPLHFEVLHEDDHVLAVSKPAGLPTMPAGGFLEHTLLALVRARDATARPLHRLGRHTSGIVLFARTAEAASALSRAWRDRSVTKTYRALVDGSPIWSNRDVTARIGPVPHPKLGSVFAATPAGRDARSAVTVLERRDETTLCDVTIATGRPHQIRVHMAWAGHPLTGDPLYGAGGLPLEPDPGLPGDGGYHLHARLLACPHPASGRELVIEAAPAPILRTGAERAARQASSTSRTFCMSSAGE